MGVERALELLGGRPRVVSIGLEHFSRELAKQGVRVVHVSWRPRQALEKDLEEILSKIL